MYARGCGCPLPLQAEKLTLESEASRAAVVNYARPRAELINAPAADFNPAVVSFPDLLDESRLWAWAGVALGDATTYLLHVSIKALAVEKQLANARFWGKVSTMAKSSSGAPAAGDYFVVECLTSVDQNPATSREQRLAMEGCEGANKYTYYVSLSPGAPDTWIALPHVTAGQLAVAQQIRRFLSGNLSSTVASFPPLPPSPGTTGPATEATLLRAMVGLITADTKLALAGFLETDTEEGLDGQGEYTIVKPAEAPESIDFDRLKDPSTFVHAELDVSPAGRTQPTPQPLGPDGEPMDLPEDQEPDPEPQAPLRSVSEDTRPCSEKETAILAEGGAPETKALWQLVGADGATLPRCPTGPMLEAGGTDGKADSAQSVVVLKSLKWPGAFTIARQGKTLVNVYMGLGVCSNGFKPTPYALKLPGPICSEWRDPAIDLEDATADATAGKVEEKDVIFEPQAATEEEE